MTSRPIFRIPESALGDVGSAHAFAPDESARRFRIPVEEVGELDVAGRPPEPAPTAPPPPEEPFR